MTIKCEKCGEELLGAVNRCWRCGTKVELGVPASPPPPSTGSVPGHVAAPPTAEPGGDVVVAELVQPPPGKDAHPQPQAATISRPRPPNLRRLSAAQGGAIAALVLGLMSVVAGFYTVLAAIPAALGLALGAWGLFSPRRGPAILGLLLCFLALATASVNGAVSLYKQAYGHAPWEAPAEPAEPEF